MKAKELLLKCKIALGLSSDYALANALKIRRQRVSEIMKTGKADEYSCYRIAEVLKRDPAEVIAEIKAETNPKHAEFWRDFLQRRGLLGLGVGLSLLSYSIFCALEAAAVETLYAAA